MAIAPPPSAGPIKLPTSRPPTPSALGQMGAAPSMKLPAAPISAAELPEFQLPDASKLHLPKPPTPGSLAGKADLAAVKAVVSRRTPERDAWAADLSKRGGVSIWWDAARRVGKETGGVKGAGQQALVMATLGATAIVTLREKRTFDRQRPFEVDPSIKVIGKVPHDPSYPSGHTSAAYSAATVLSALDPPRAKEYMSVAAQVGASRVYAGVHFPTDVAAGAAIGIVAGKVAVEAAKRGGLDASNAMRDILGLYNANRNKNDGQGPATAKEIGALDTIEQ